MKLFVNKFATCLTFVLIVLCYSCAPTERAAPHPTAKPADAERKPPEAKPADIGPTETKPVETRSPAAEPKPKEQPVVEKPVEQSSVVAEIGDYVITRREVEERLLRELSDDPEDYMTKEGVIDAKTVALQMVADKAMIIEGREQGLMKDDSFIRRFREEKLIDLLLEGELQGRITVTDSEIEQKMKSDSRLDRARARMVVEREKQDIALEQFYDEILEKRRVKKVRFNFPIAAQIHQRLLLSPQKERKGYWIKGWQIEDELTTEEKNIALATFDNGAVTLLDWFNMLHRIPPLKRPKDLHTIQGVERLLDIAMRTPIFVAEARSRGLDRDENLLQEVEKQEGTLMLAKVKRRLFEDVKEPTSQETADYFNKHREEFRRRNKLKIDQIWCEDLETARNVKEELDRGRDFESAKKEYSLSKGEQPHYASVGTDGLLFADIWKGEPNEIVGPVKGFYRRSVKWRIVKILEKEPGELRKYSSGVEYDVKRMITREQKEAIMDKYRKELLAKYPHKIYSERMKDIDPLNIP